MKDVVDRILNTYQVMRPLDPEPSFRFKTENYARPRKPDLCRSKRCPAVGGVRFGLFERAARGGETLGLPAARILALLSGYPDDERRGRLVMPAGVA
jgi:hypothetical protein